MYEPSQVNLGLGIIGDDRGLRFQRQLTFAYVVRWIKAQNLDDYTKKELIKRASKYPHNALAQFGNSIEHQVVEIQREKAEKERLKEERYEKENIEKGGENKQEESSQESLQATGDEKCGGHAASSQNCDEDCGGRSDVHPEISDDGSSLL